MQKTIMKKNTIVTEIDGLRKSKNKINTLIVSDIHLGSKVSRSSDLLKLIKQYQVNKHTYLFDRLILLGDVFDDLNFKRLPKHAWELVGTFRNITDEESNAEIVWLLGNHDLHWAQLMEHMVGINTYREYIWNVCGKNFLAMHGDRFDKWIMNFPTLVNIPCWIYEMIQQLDGDKQRFSRFIKEKSKVWLRINDAVAEGMITYTRNLTRPVDAVFCGHTHLVEEKFYPRDNIWYYNTGCWTGKQNPTYATINQQGEVKIRQYSQKPAITRIAVNS